MNKLNRNNTSFIKELTEQLKKIKQTENDVLKYYQRVTHDYVLSGTVRGVLAYYEMGAGKSILAASILVSAIEAGNVRKVLFISGKSLHDNMRTNIKKYLELNKKGLSGAEMDTYIAENFKFVSMNASNMLKQVYRNTTISDEILTESFETFIESSDETEASPRINPQQLLKEMEQLNLLGNLDDTFVVIDEAHNFFNSVTNASKNAVGLYYLIMHAKNIKLLFLTGSPIVNDPYEIAICYNMLAGYLPGKNVLFGEDYKDFVKYFISSAEQIDVDYKLKPGETQALIIKNADKFTNRIVGLTSHYSTKSGEITKLFPKLLEPIIEYIPMSNRQYAAYALARDRELEESARGGFRAKATGIGKPQGASSSYRVRSRQISNFLYPSYASNTFKDSRGFIRYEKFIEKLKPEVFMYHAGKTEAEDQMGLETWSPKLCKLLINLSRHLPKNMLSFWRDLSTKHGDLFKTVKSRAEIKDEAELKAAEVEIQADASIQKSKDKKEKSKDKKEKSKDKKEKSKDKKEKSKNKKGKAEKTKYGVGPGVVYSQFIDAGIGLLAKALQTHGFTEVSSVNDVLKTETHKGRYAIISGEVDPEIRSEILKIFISPENMHGEVLPLLLITSTGAEGLDTKYVRHVHVMEPFWHWSRIAQVFARGARLGSHLDLPESERDVQPYIYLADYPLKFEDVEQGKIKILEDTTDVTLYLKALQNQVLIDSFLEQIKLASMDCLIHYQDRPCKICHPTGELLYIDNLERDMQAPSPCQPIKEEKIKAKSVIVEVTRDDIKVNKEFMYSLIDGKIHIFGYDEKLNGYIEISEFDPDYDLIISKIKKAKK